MVTKPPMVQQPSPNRNGYGGKRRVDALVWHVTVGSAASSLGWLTNPASGASSNYLIARDGTIYELVPPTEDAWANGAVNKPDTANPVIAHWLTENVNFNQRTISVEHERLTSANEQPGGFTEAQHRSTVALAAYLCGEFDVPPDRQHIIGHRSIDSVNRLHCPGLAESEWDAWVAEVAAIVDAPPQPQTPLPKPLPGDPGSIRAYVAPNGNTVIELNFGGVAVSLDGFAVQDVGVTVVNAAGEHYSRTCREGAFLPWHKEA